MSDRFVLGVTSGFQSPLKGGGRRLALLQPEPLGAHIMDSWNCYRVVWWENSDPPFGNFKQEEVNARVLERAEEELARFNRQTVSAGVQ